MPLHHSRSRVALTLAVALVSPLIAQTPTEFTATLNLVGNSVETATHGRIYAGVGPVGKLGNALIRFNASQRLADDYTTPTGPVSPMITLAFNRLDQITVGSGQGIQDPAIPTANIVGGVSGGTGAYAGASSPPGTLRLAFTRVTSPQAGYRFSLAGAATVGGQQVDIAVTDVPLSPIGTMLNVFDTESGTATVSGFGNANVTVRSHPILNRWNDDPANFLEINVNLNFSPTETLRSFVTLHGVDGVEQFSPVTITGGTGRFAGATGTGRLSVTGPQENEVVSLAGTITLAGPSTPIVTSVNTASGVPNGNLISQNAWIEIKGTNLVPPTTPAGGTFWSNAPEFAQGRMPTELGGVTVTINGKPAFIWWFCSAATTASCATDQINVLAPLDDYIGQVPVAVKNGASTSGVFLANKSARSPAFLLFAPRGEPVATHASGSLLGATTLFPGLSTPAARGETVSLWAVGFGLPKEPLIAGSATQTGTLSEPLACTVAGLSAPVAAALVSPGLYQLNVTIPQNAPAGDAHLFCTYPSAGTTPAVLVAIQ